MAVGALVVAAVGPAWLAGSFLTGGRVLHQAVLAAALIAFPAGRVRGVASWLLVALAGLTGLQLLPQLGVAALFAAERGLDRHEPDSRAH